jgi:hypothetical protein
MEMARSGAALRIPWTIQRFSAQLMLLETAFAEVGHGAISVKAGLGEGWHGQLTKGGSR